MKVETALLSLALLAGCGEKPPPDRRMGESAHSVVAAPVASRVDPASPAAARELVSRYYRLIADKRFNAAQGLWSPGPIGAEAPGMFAARFAGEEKVRAEVGEPNAPEGAAGSIYISVPVAIRGAPALAMNRPYLLHRLVVLRRVNDVPGSSTADRQWHIHAVHDMAAGPTGAPNPIAF